MANNRGYVEINGGADRVHYLCPPPANTTEFTNEVRVLESFLNAWNANIADMEHPGSHPSDTQASPPATSILVDRSINLEAPVDLEAPDGKEGYISVWLATALQWAPSLHNNLQCRQFGAKVRVFCVNGDPSQGFKGFTIKSPNGDFLAGPEMSQAIETIANNRLGILGTPPFV